MLTATEVAERHEEFQSTPAITDGRCATVMSRRVV